MRRHLWIGAIGLIAAGCTSGTTVTYTTTTLPIRPPSTSARSSARGNAGQGANASGGAGTYRYEASDGSSVTIQIPGPNTDPQIVGLRQFARFAGGPYASAVFVKATLDNKGTQDLGLNGVRIITTARQQVDALNEVEFENNIDASIPSSQVPAYNALTAKLDAHYPPHVSGGVLGTTYFVLTGVSPDQIGTVDVPDQLGPGDPVGQMVAATKNG